MRHAARRRDVRSAAQEAPPRRLKRALARLGDAFLTLAAVAGVLGLLLFLGIQTGRLQTLVVVSGSMIPTYEVGDAIVSRRVPASTLEVGDVVSVFTRDGVLVTHRIVGIDEEPAGDERALTLRGDNNPVDDPEPYVVSDALVPMVRIPGARDAIEVLRRPAVGIPVVVAACALVGFALMPSGKRRPEDEAGDDAHVADTSPGDHSGGGDRDRDRGDVDAHGPPAARR